MFTHSTNCNLIALPVPPSGSNTVANDAQLVEPLVTAAMKAAGVVASAPCERTAPVAEVSLREAASVPVANAAVDGAPVAPDVTTKAADCES